MTDLTTTLFDGVSSAAPYLLMALVDLTVKGSLIVLAAIIGSALLRSRSAAQRHLLWTTALFLLLLLPVLNIFLPAVPLPLLSADLFIEPDYSTSISIGEVSTDIYVDPYSVIEESAAETSIFAGFDWKFWLAGLWLMGGLVAAVWLAGGKLKARGLLRWSQPIGDQSIQLLVKRLTSTFGIRHTFRVRKTNAVKVPVVIGILNRTILLPSEAIYWTEEKLNTMLLHELAHIKRHDMLLQVPAQILSAMFWFNPLVWFATHKQIKEREKAADDMVINAGIRASCYAKHLLEAAQRLTNNQNYNWATMGMARGEDFKSRVQAIVNSSTNRKPLSMETALVTLLTFALLMLPLAAWQMWDSESAVASNDEASEIIDFPDVFVFQDPGILEVTGAVIRPEVSFSGPQPIPERAKIEKVGGQVKVKLIIRKDGSYEFVEILEEDPVDYGFADATLKYLTQSTWKPAKFDGKPVDVYYTLTIMFNLNLDNLPKELQDKIPAKALEKLREYAKQKQEQGREEIKTVHGDITKPKFKFIAKQPYPEKAKKAGIEGTVKVRLIIRKDGSYELMEILKEEPEDAGFGDAAIEYLKQSVWQPATENGKPIDVYYELTIKFNLAEKTDDKIYNAGAGFDKEIELSEPELVHRVEPEYPDAARKAGYEGFVLIQAIVNKEGIATDIKILQAPPAKYGFAEAARAAVEQWKFKPSTHKGKPVNVRIRFSVEFNLGYSDPDEKNKPTEPLENFQKPTVKFVGKQPFPKKAQVQRRSGKVQVRLIIRADGSYEIKEFLSVSLRDFGFEEAAREYLKQSVWTPAMKDGKPTDVYYNLTIVFPFKKEEKTNDNPIELTEEITPPRFSFSGAQPFPQKA